MDTVETAATQPSAIRAMEGNFGDVHFINNRIISPLLQRNNHLDGGEPKFVCAQESNSTFAAKTVRVSPTAGRGDDNHA